MAKMGQQMLPQNITNDLNENDDDWVWKNNQIFEFYWNGISKFFKNIFKEKSSSTTNETLKAQANFTNMQNIQLNTLQEATAASNLLLQQRNQQLQQQLTSLQNQQFSMQPNPMFQAQSNSNSTRIKFFNDFIYELNLFILFRSNSFVQKFKFGYQ